MSSILKWRPCKEYGHSLSDGMKFAMRDYFDVTHVQHRLTEDNIPYLRGLRDGGNKEAQKLVDAIGRHGEIEMKEHY